MAIEQKPGWKTSEFWVTVAGTLLPLLNESGALGFRIPVETVIQGIYAIMAYVGSRSLLKAVAAYKQPVDHKKLNN